MKRAFLLSVACGSSTVPRPPHTDPVPPEIGVACTPAGITAPPTVQGTLAVAALDGDGHLDLLTSSTDSGGHYEIATYLGAGDGSFVPGMVLPLSAFGLAVADLDGNGLPEVIGLRISTDGTAFQLEA